MKPPVRVLGLDHVTITTPPVLEAETVAWYELTLCLERLQKPMGARPGGAWFRAGRQQIHVSLEDRNPHPTAHFGIVVGDFQATIERLREGGFHIEQARLIPGRRRAFTRDPAGNGVEILDREAGATTAMEHRESAQHPPEGTWDAEA
jgi:catechol 2,3-dioxygenase-like lactoylglutathione lyase family enzyme